MTKQPQKMNAMIITVRKSVVKNKMKKAKTKRKKRKKNWNRMRQGAVRAATKKEAVTNEAE